MPTGTVHIPSKAGTPVSSPQVWYQVVAGIPDGAGLKYGPGTGIVGFEPLNASVRGYDPGVSLGDVSLYPVRPVTVEADESAPHPYGCPGLLLPAGVTPRNHPRYTGDAQYTVTATTGQAVFWYAHLNFAAPGYGTPAPLILTPSEIAARATDYGTGAHSTWVLWACENDDFPENNSLAGFDMGGTALLTPTIAVSDLCSGAPLLSWSPVIDPEFGGTISYLLERAPVSTGTYVQIYAGTGTTCTDTTCTLTVPYLWRVRAVRVSDGLVSAYSVPVAGTPNLVPSSPTGLAATVTVDNTVGVCTTTANVSWTDSARATSYTLQRDAGNTGTWTTVYSGPGTSTALAALLGRTDRFRVRATNACGDSDWSAPVSVSPSLAWTLPTVTLCQVCCRERLVFRITGGAAALLSGTTTDGEYGADTYSLDKDGTAIPGAPIDPAHPTAFVYRDDTVVAGQTYTYSLSASWGCFTAPAVTASRRVRGWSAVLAPTGSWAGSLPSASPWRTPTCDCDR